MLLNFGCQKAYDDLLKFDGFEVFIRKIFAHYADNCRSVTISDMKTESAGYNQVFYPLLIQSNNIIMESL